MMQQIKDFVLQIMLVVMVLTLSAFLGAEMVQAETEATEGQQASDHETTEPATDSGDSASDISSPGYPQRNYLFIHDTSLNMRRRRRIPLMQTSIRAVLDNVPLTSYVGMSAFGHRFSVDGLDACSDVDVLIPIDRLNKNQEDFELHLNLLKNPLLGGGAPVGLALRQGIADLQSFQGQKELYLYLVDLQKCPEDKAIETIKSACNIEDLHLTLVGIGLKRDFKTLQQASVDQLGCVDILNILTREETEALPDKLLTRLSVEFQNAEGQLVDPRPGGDLVLQLFRKDLEGNLESVRKKVKNLAMKGRSIETVGLDEGTYFMDMSYQGQKLRVQKEIMVTTRDELSEVVQLGKMLIDITDSEGKPISDPEARNLKITLTDAGQTIRNAVHTPSVAFDLLPGNQYKVFVSYMVGGSIQNLEFDQAISISEGNHKKVSIQLPLGSINGKVVDIKGQPVQGVEIALSAAEEEDAGFDETRVLKQARSITDERGNYFFQDVKAGTYRLILGQPGYKVERKVFSVVGGRINNIEDFRLFHGLEVVVSGTSGHPVFDADVTIVHKASSQKIPILREENIYQNAEEMPAGEYTVSVQRTGYQSASQDVTLQDDVPYVAIPVQLPYYIAVRGTLVDGKGVLASGATVEFQHTNTTLTISEDQRPVKSADDGSFQVELLVSGKGDEQVNMRWLDFYNQTYAKKLTIPLPPAPQKVELGEIRLPINFLHLTIHDVIGNNMRADTVVIYHEQSGQSGIQMNLRENGIYESAALLDGNYTIRIIKRGYQEIEQTFSVTGGQIKNVPITLQNYITVAGTVTDGKNNRVPEASIVFQGAHSKLTSLQSIVTGKDGRFQATLLVKKTQKEQIEITWKSPKSGKEYRISATFDLPGIPIAEYLPINLGNYQLPANFVRVEVQDVSKKGLPGADVTFISSQGKITKGLELGDGVYESLDLYDGYYNIAIARKGYKENVIISDIAVGKSQREVKVGPVALPHYATVKGVVLNGNDEGMSNVDITFKGNTSEQLERCRTDQHGRFSTTLLVTSTGQEEWTAVWKRKEFSASGTFSLPLFPDKFANIGEIHLPANFVSIPVEDIQGNTLSGVNIAVFYKDRTPVELKEFALEEIEPGIYQARNLPDGNYSIFLHKDGYERDKYIDVTAQGGKHIFLKPVKMGYYITIGGTTINGKQEPVSGSVITFRELYSTLISIETRTVPTEPGPEGSVPSTVEGEEEREELSLDRVSPSIVTDAQGKFSATVLVRSPGIEQIVVTWGEKYSSSYQVNLSGGPGRRNMTMRLPINFIQVQLKDVARAPLAGAFITATDQVEKTVFPLKEGVSGTYESPELPNGNYIIVVEKDQYESQTKSMSVKDGQLKQTSLRLNHYVTVKGHVVGGKEEGVSAATISFGNLKTESAEKVISGTDGAFETQLLVKEAGKEAGQITWVGSHATYTKEFLVNLPLKPESIVLPNTETRLPVNHISLEVKSVAATGVSGAIVKLTNRETGQIIEAWDNQNGNYEGIELSDGAYDIFITKDRYKAVTLENITVTGGEHKSDILVPKFPHYITISGIVLNGKNLGVANAQVAVREPKRVQECDPFTSRKDGSFTLQALVTDVGSETLEVVWNTMYSTALPVKLPSVPDHMRVDPIKLPINFIAVNVRDIYGVDIPEATISFVPKEQTSSKAQPSFDKLMTNSSNSAQGSHTVSTIPQSPGIYTARETSPGIYESPDLPNNRYIIVARKEGYTQNAYPEVIVRAGVNESDKRITLPHLVTVKGRVINGKDNGVPGVKVIFGEKNSQGSNYQLYTDEQGYFTDRLQVTGTDTETITFSKQGPLNRPRDQFEIVQEFALPKTPKEQEFDDIRLPINFVPIRVQDVSGRTLSDAEVLIIPISKEEEQSAAAGRGLSNFGSSVALKAIKTEDGRYEGQNLRDGTYSISVAEKGYQHQEKTVSVISGEVAPEVVFILPHYIVVKGMVVDGKGDGVSDALLEFDSQNSELIVEKPSIDDQSFDPSTSSGHRKLSTPQSTIKTDLNGQFVAKLLVKKVETQRARVSWNTAYVKQFFFPLPDQPETNLTLAEAVRLPVNFVPFRITDVLSQGLAGAEISLRKTNNNEDSLLLAHALGAGYYEARELADGVYMMTIHKEGYQETTGNLSVHAGQQMLEQQFSLPHYVTVRGTIINGKGTGVAGATITLAGLSSRLLRQDEPIVTTGDGSFQVDLLVTGSGDNELPEHIEVSWTAPSQSTNNPSTSSGPRKQQSSIRTIPFGISYDFSLPPKPGTKNLGILGLPAHFFPVTVRDISGKGLSGVNVTFIDENDRAFPSREFSGGYYEGQNLPNGTYTIRVSKDGYRKDQKTGVAITEKKLKTPGTSVQYPLTFQLPYYVDIKGTSVNGKGEELGSNIALELAGVHSRFVAGSIHTDQQGNFKARLLVTETGPEQLHITWLGDHGQHDLETPILLPGAPQTLDLGRINLPVNFIPIEVKDLLGYGMTEAAVTLRHLETEEEIRAEELENGRYEGQDLIDGTYEISISKEGYKSVEHALVTVSGGVVSPTRSFRLRHYVWVTGIVTNGEGEGVRDPVIDFEGRRSHSTSKRADITGRFEAQLEVQEVGSERLYLSWQNGYRTPVTFTLPGRPEKKDLGEIRLPINFLSVLVNDISGSTLKGVDVTVKDSSGTDVQVLRTNSDGFCKTKDLTNGLYQVIVNKPGYKAESQDIQMKNGQLFPIRFTLPHYVMVQGYIRDIKDQPVGEAEIVFEEFTDVNGQKLQTNPDPATGLFEQQLLIDNPAFLERQKGHFMITKNNTEQQFTFKIPTEPNKIVNYKTLLFPTKYLHGKVVDAEEQTIPLDSASISLTFVGVPSVPEADILLTQVEKNSISQEPVRLMTNSLGVFEIGNLQNGEYKIIIKKEGYHTHEDFVQISGLLQEQEFALLKQQ